MFSAVCQQMARITAKVSVHVVLTLLLLSYSVLATAQGGCDNDGFTVDFKDKKGSLELRRVRVREITGNRSDDLEISLGSTTLQSVASSAGRVDLTDLSLNAFPSNNINTASIRRRERNAWSVNFKRGDYEFNDRSDLQLDIEVTVTNNQATHISGGASAVTISASDADVDVRWFGGKRNDLRSIKGDLNIQFSDLAQLGLQGTHRAEINLCINIRGNL